jgi:hypothetical protein
MNKLALMLNLFFFPLLINASSLFVPDADSAVLLQILGTEIEASAGILKILDVSSKTMTEIQKAHFKADDIHTKAIQAEYYANVLVNYPKTREDVRSMVTLRDNLQAGKDLWNDRKTLTLGYDVLKKSNDSLSRIASSGLKKNKLDQKMANLYFKKAANSQRSVEGALFAARASALGTVQLVDINQSIDLLSYQTLINSDHMLSKERNEQLSKFRMKKRWGMVPKEMSFKEYIQGSYSQKRRSSYANGRI